MYKTFIPLLSLLLLFVGFMPARAESTLQAGDLVKGSMATVYYYHTDGKRYVFPTEKTYFSWFDGFQNVKTISDNQLAGIALGGNITYNSVNQLVKITTDPKVYAVEPGGVLRHVISETVATQALGNNWAKKVHDIPDAFFFNYSIGEPIIDAYQYTANKMAFSIGDDIAIRTSTPKKEYANDYLRFTYPKDWQMVSESGTTGGMVFFPEGPGSAADFRCGNDMAEEDLMSWDMQITERDLAFSDYALKIKHLVGIPMQPNLLPLNYIKIDYIDKSGIKDEAKSCMLRLRGNFSSEAWQIFYSMDAKDPAGQTFAMSIPVQSRNGQSAIINPVWVKLINGMKFAVDTQNKKVYTANEAGEYFEYIDNIAVEPPDSITVHDSGSVKVISPVWIEPRKK